MPWGYEINPVFLEAIPHKIGAGERLPFIMKYISLRRTKELRNSRKSIILRPFAMPRPGRRPTLFSQSRPICIR